MKAENPYTAPGVPTDVNIVDFDEQSVTLRWCKVNTNLCQNLFKNLILSVSAFIRWWSPYFALHYTGKSVKKQKREMFFIFSPIAPHRLPLLIALVLLNLHRRIFSAITFVSRQYFINIEYFHKLHFYLEKGRVWGLVRGAHHRQRQLFCHHRCKNIFFCNLR